MSESVNNVDSLLFSLFFFLALLIGEEEEGEVVVDGDDTSIFGPPQYSDADVIRAQGRSELHRSVLISAFCFRLV